MGAARFVRVGRRFGSVVALRDFSLEVAPGELVTVLGPSGCGKSTLLRCTAGLDELSEGEIWVDERRVDRLAPDRRDVAMVFQSYALYPHLSVRDNIEFPLRMQGVPTPERCRRSAEAAEMVELAGLLDRRPAELSGGQRQRVALARALVRRPSLFLLDEPLSNLDARLRTSVRRSIRDLQRRLGVTTLYVTHDQAEAMTLGDRIVVLAGGEIRQVGAPHEVWERPADAFVAGFVGTPPMNLIDGRVVAGAVEVGDARLALPAELRSALPDGTVRVRVGVRPEAFAAEGPTGGAGLLATVEPETCELLGAERLVSARLGADRVTVRLPGAGPSLPERVLAPASALHIFESDSGRRLGP